MTGRGSPVALQFNFKLPPTHATTLAGGMIRKRGGETTTKKVSFQHVPTDLMPHSSRGQSHLYEHVVFVMHRCCTSLFPGVMDRMTFSIRLRVQDSQSRDRVGEYNFFLQWHNKVPYEGKLEGELEQIEYFDWFALFLLII